MSEIKEGIISIRPRYAQAILTGRKSFELRRRVPRVGVGTRLWIYSTLPVGAVVGSVVICGIARGSVNEIWEKCGATSEISRAAFDEYFSGVDKAVGLELFRPSQIAPVGIDQLRLMRKKFHPPQVLLKISKEESAFLKSFKHAA